MKIRSKWWGLVLIFSLPIAMWLPLRVAGKPRLNKHLLLASYKGNADEVQNLLALGADPNYVDQELDQCALRVCAPYLDTPLINATYHASTRGKKAIIRLLLDAGADVRAKNSRGQTPLLNLIMSNEPDLLRELLQRGAGKGQSLDELLCRAVYAGKTEAVRVLLDAGAKVNARDRKGATALQVAYYHLGFGSYESPFDQTIALLIERGADINDLGNETPPRNSGRISARRRRLYDIISTLPASAAKD